MTNAELIKRLRDIPCWAIGTETEETMLAAVDALEADDKRIAGLEADKKTLINVVKDKSDFHATKDAMRIAELEAQLPKEGKWIMDEYPHDGDCRCSVCLIAIDAMHERNHELLNALTGGKWWKFYRYCPNCGAKMIEKEKEGGGEDGDIA